MAIRLLAPDVVAGISAGEVIERPASVVKELVENALDAGASRIAVHVEKGGLRSIRVVDNGCGIPENQAELAFSRHATSKITSLEDLGDIRTLGFRGEALAAIATAADVEMMTRATGAREGTLVTVKDGKATTSPAGSETGTDVRVLRLFARIPARLKFMKSNAGETGAITRTMEKYALGWPGIHFVLTVDGGERLNAPPARDHQARARSLLGDSGREMIAFDGDNGRIKVHGLADAPGKMRGRGRVWLFVNGRPVEDRVIRHALASGYGGAIPAGTFPTAVVFLEMPASMLDVNVHPAKTEVKFLEQDFVHSMLSRCLRETFSGTLKDTGRRPAGTGAGSGRVAGLVPTTPEITGEPVGELPLADSGTARAWPAGDAAGPAGDIQVLGQTHRTYIVARKGASLIIIDQHAAHEKVIFERIISRRSKSPSTQPLLVPATVELSVAEAAFLEKVAGALEELGYEIDSLGGRTAVIRSVPAASAAVTDHAGFLKSVLSDAMEEDGQRKGDNPAIRMAATMACHMAVRAGDVMHPREMEALVGELFACRDPRTCPHGRPTVRVFEEQELARMFRRE